MFHNYILIGPKRRMDRSNSRPVKKQATNLPTIDSSFASVAIPQSDSFKVYRSSCEFRFTLLSLFHFLNVFFLFQ